VAVDLTANLAKNEPDPYVKQTHDFALLEDFDHLYRYSCLYDYIEGGDPEAIVQGKTEVKPGRPTSIEHRHPDDSMRKHYDKDTADIKTKMNYNTIVSGSSRRCSSTGRTGARTPTRLRGSCMRRSRRSRSST
jgi:hypothetical protein